MSEFIQQILTGCAVIAAAAFIFKHYLEKRKLKSGCAACKLMQTAVKPRSAAKSKLNV